jgi:hypothetical protein
MARQAEQRGAVLSWQLAPVGEQRLWADTCGVQRAHFAIASGVEAAAAHIACRHELQGRQHSKTLTKAREKGLGLNIGQLCQAVHT